MLKACTVMFFGMLAFGSVASAELQDPTRPSYAVAGAVVEASSGALHVSAIFISGERRIAIINGRRLRVGETVNGAIVSKIEQDRVSFVRGDEVFAVSLLSGSSRQ
ncbi:MAG: hypothetical protein WBN32_06105 [Woeseia sp.]